MATAEAVAQVVGMLGLIWPEQVKAKSGTKEGLAMLAMQLEEVRDEWLGAAAKDVMRRAELRSSDNLGEILREAAHRLRGESEKARAKAEGERRHQLALEDLRSEKAMIGAAGATLDQKPAAMSFRDWLRESTAMLAAEPDPLRRAERMVGSAAHSMDPQLREPILRCLAKAKDRRAARHEGPPRQAGEDWAERAIPSGEREDAA